MAAKLLAGPYEYSGGGIWAVSPWNARVRLCTITYHSAMNGIDNEAQARLFATAPDLLAGAEAVMVWVDALQPYSEAGTELAPVFKTLRATIAKIRGAA